MPQKAGYNRFKFTILSFGDLRKVTGFPMPVRLRLRSRTRWGCSELQARYYPSVFTVHAADEDGDGACHEARDPLEEKFNSTRSSYSLHASDSTSCVCYSPHTFHNFTRRFKFQLHAGSNLTLAATVRCSPCSDEEFSAQCSPIWMWNCGVECEQEACFNSSRRVHHARRVHARGIWGRLGE